MAAREQSPTLRMFTSGDKEPGAKKRSVLDRLEDSKFSKSSPPKVFINVSFNSLFAFRRIKVRRSSRRKRWQIPCEGYFCAVWANFFSFCTFSFLAGFQLARKWQRGWLPFSQRRMRYIFHPADVTIVWSACPEGFVWLCWPTWQEIWGPWKGSHQEPQRQWQVKTMNRSDRYLLCSGIVWEPNKIRPQRPKWQKSRYHARLKS